MGQGITKLALSSAGMKIESRVVPGYESTQNNLSETLKGILRFQEMLGENTDTGTIDSMYSQAFSLFGNRIYSTRAGDELSPLLGRPWAIDGVIQMPQLKMYQEY